jgi:hypothetical protein
MLSRTDMFSSQIFIFFFDKSLQSLSFRLTFQKFGTNGKSALPMQTTLTEASHT